MVGLSTGLAQGPENEIDSVEVANGKVVVAVVFVEKVCCAVTDGRLVGGLMDDPEFVDDEVLVLV